MSEISRSPNRHTFQRDAYLRRCKEQEEEPSEDHLRLMDTRAENHLNRFVDNIPGNDLEYDLLTTPWILDKARASKSYAQNIYAALCKQDWQRTDVIPILRDETWSCSWRRAGGIVADMRQQGDYIDWYCSGMGGLNAQYKGEEETHAEWRQRTGYVPESLVTEEIEKDLYKLGWHPVNNEDDHI